MQTKLITGVGCTDEFAAAPSYVLIGLGSNGIERIKQLARAAMRMKEFGVDEIRADATSGDIRVVWLSSVTVPNLQGVIVLNDELKADLEADALDDGGGTDDYDITDMRIRGTSICVDKSSFYVWAYDKDSRVQYEGKRVDFSDIPDLADLTKEFEDIETLGPAYVQAASDQYVGDDIKIDENPHIAMSSFGAWVPAWLFVSDEAAGLSDEEEESHGK